MSGVVVDANVALKWLVPEPLADEASELLDGWVSTGTQVFAPYLLPIEVANALHKRALRLRDLSGAAEELLDRLGLYGVNLYEPPGIHRRAMELARSLRLPAVYDAHYLALAEVLGCELWTADERLYNAVVRQFPAINLLGAPASRG